MNETEQEKLLATPLGFTEGVLGLTCYPCIQKVLLDLDAPGQVSVAAANGIGKSSRIGAPAAIWNAAVHPGSLTIVSAGVHRQVVELLQSIHAYRSKFPRWEFLTDTIRTDRGSRILGFTCDRPELFEGFHSEHLLIVLDEAKSIDDGVYSAALRCQPERLLLLSSPGGRAGFFFESFHSRRKFFKTHTITAFEASHISPKWIADTIEQFGETHPYVRSAVYGEFSELDSDVVIPLSFVQNCLANPPAFVDGEVKAFCDFAGNAAENVLAICRGNRVEIAAAWREGDTAHSIGKFLNLFKEHNLSVHQIHGDADGLGCVYLDMLAENGWPINRFHGGKPASNSEVYFNAIAEAWYSARRLFEKRLVILPNDAVLIGQLTSRKGHCNSKGQLCLESKDEMRARGLPSPDRADAFVGALVKPTGTGWDAQAVAQVRAANPHIAANPAAPAEFDRERERQPFRLQQPGQSFPGVRDLSRTAANQFRPRHL
jgi:hypothetical protein